MSGEWWEASDEGWAMSGEWWVMRGEWWMVSAEGWVMRSGWWEVRDVRWKMRVEWWFREITKTKILAATPNCNISPHCCSWGEMFLKSAGSRVSCFWVTSESGFSFSHHINVQDINYFHPSRNRYQLFTTVFPIWGPFYNSKTPYYNCTGTVYCMSFNSFKNSFI